MASLDRKDRAPLMTKTESDHQNPSGAKAHALPKNTRCVSASAWCTTATRVGAIAVVAVLMSFCASPTCQAQGSSLDYERSSALESRTRDRVFRNAVSPNWVRNNTAFWYRVRTATSSYEFVFVDAEKGVRVPAFDHARVAEQLTEKAGRTIEGSNLPFRQLEWLDGGKWKFAALGKSWICDRQSSLIKEAGAGESDADGIPPLKTLERSGRQGREVYLTFRNATEKKVELFWINESGQRQSYAVIEPGKTHRQHTFERHVWVAIADGREPVAAFKAPGRDGEAIIDGKSRPQRPSRSRSRSRTRGARRESSDGVWEASVRDNNVFVRNRQTNESVQLTKDGIEDHGYSGQFYWSPDSKKLVALRERDGEEHTVHIVESSPSDQLQPKLISFDYTKPGDRIRQIRPCLFDLESLEQIPVSNVQFDNPWSINTVSWDDDSKAFRFLYNQRGHQVIRLVEVAAESGDVRLIVDEQSDTFLDYSYKFYQYPLRETDELIWMSERDGWNHLYLYDTRAGTVKNQITKGKWIVRGVESVDVERREILFRASGIVEGQDPYYIHYCRIGFDGEGLTVLTEGDGTHKVTFSPDNKYLIDEWSRVDHPPVFTLRNARSGEQICDLESADWEALTSSGWSVPERFVAKGRDNRTDIYGIIVRPSNYDPSRRYPVIEKIYAGPQGSFVPKAFGRLVNEHALAELGFIVVQIDGMGTSNRDKAFHAVCWKNLGDAGFPDRILWLKAAAEQHPQLDLERVGIYGGSAGGQNALRAMLAHGDFYRAAVADCGCHDNRMDKIWWNELWMSWPIGPHYEVHSNVTHAGRLTGKLMLVVGELDRNVDPASTMQVVNALIKADKDFDFVIIPGAGHGAAESRYGKRRRKDFFVRHLLGVEPRWSPTQTADATESSE